jgi:hypothetical protein
VTRTRHFDVPRLRPGVRYATRVVKFDVPEKALKPSKIHKACLGSASASLFPQAEREKKKEKRKNNWRYLARARAHKSWKMTRSMKDYSYEESEVFAYQSPMPFLA